MWSLEKRIAALEAITAPADDLTVIRRIVRPGHVDAEIYRLLDDDDNEWTRQPDETEQAIVNRATLETKPNDWGVRALTAETWEPTDATD